MNHRKLLLLGICTAFFCGCIIPSQEALRNPGIGDQSDAKLASANKGLIKPYIPSEQGPVQVAQEEKPVMASSPEPSAPVTEVSPKNESTEAPTVAPAVSVDGNASNKKDKKWEDQKVKAAAMQLAQSFPGIKKLKVCYAVKEDEWWVTLYEESGPVFDLKQYTWNREQDKLEPFLVPKRLTADRLQAHLTEHEADMACEVLDPGAGSRN